MVHKVRFFSGKKKKNIYFIASPFAGEWKCLSSVKCYTTVYAGAISLNIFFLLFFSQLVFVHFTSLFVMVECNLSVLGTDFSRDLWYLKCVDTFSIQWMNSIVECRFRWYTQYTYTYVIVRVYVSPLADTHRLSLIARNIESISHLNGKKKNQTK